MRYRWAARTLALAGVLSLGMSDESIAAPINIITATGDGGYYNSPGRLIDGEIPDEGTWWASSTNVYWNGTAPFFTLEFDSVYTLVDLLVQVDNNDDYLIQYSLNGADWVGLYTIPGSAGNINGGMDTFIPSEINFSPVNARYIRLSALDGDNMYAISEVQAFGTSPVPEPASVVLLGSGLFALFGYRAKKETY
ncbi:MAG: PEP-CTERM sorting domain-containing protein [Chlorobiaceae bacterium]|jgi:hypothetical protein|nr:PEP-CTERM sorting domain-containing protein [Chlorobiaceae bacterium]